MMDPEFIALFDAHAAAMAQLEQGLRALARRRLSLPSLNDEDYADDDDESSHTSSTSAS